MYYHQKLNSLLRVSHQTLSEQLKYGLMNTRTIIMLGIHLLEMSILEMLLNGESILRFTQKSRAVGKNLHTTMKQIRPDGSFDIAFCVLYITASVFWQHTIVKSIKLSAVLLKYNR